jgi:hypothetical protein
MFTIIIALYLRDVFVKGKSKHNSIYTGRQEIMVKYFSI